MNLLKRLQDQGKISFLVSLFSGMVYFIIDCFDIQPHPWLLILNLLSISFKSRELYGSKIYKWNDSGLVSVLGSILLKMCSSPHDKVELIDPNRPYIIMSKDQWRWAKMKFKPSFSLKYRNPPRRDTNTFILIADFRGGAHGRVWMVCSTSGRVGVIKFPQGREDVMKEPEIGVALAIKRLKEERDHWRNIWGFGKEGCRIVTLCGQRALLMPYVKPVITSGQRRPEIDSIPSEVLSPVKKALHKMASKGLCHGDLHWGHVGLLSEPKRRGKAQRAVLFDLARVEEAAPKVAMRKMMECLHLDISEDDDDFKDLQGD